MQCSISCLISRATCAVDLRIQLESEKARISAVKEGNNTVFVRQPNVAVMNESVKLQSSLSDAVFYSFPRFVSPI